MKHTFSIEADSSNGNGKVHPNNILPLLLDTTSSALAYINGNYCYEYVNKAYANWFGTTPANITGKLVRDFISTEAFLQIKPYTDRAMQGEEVQYAEEVGKIYSSF